MTVRKLYECQECGKALPEGYDPQLDCEKCLEEDDEDFVDPEACPGCGCLPGDGLTDGCEHPEGCGHDRPIFEEARVIAGLSHPNWKEPEDVEDENRQMRMKLWGEELAEKKKAVRVLAEMLIAKVDAIEPYNGSYGAIAQLKMAASALDLATGSVLMADKLEKGELS